MIRDDGLRYTASDGETWDSVALDLYGDEKYTNQLLNANPTLVLKMDGATFQGGEILNVPVLEVTETELGDELNKPPTTAPWRQEG